jgi:hypothetical protein
MINWLMLFKEIIALYTENHTRPINKKKSHEMIVEAGGTYSYHGALKGLKE